MCHHPFWLHLCSKCWKASSCHGQSAGFLWGPFVKEEQFESLNLWHVMEARSEVKLYSKNCTCIGDYLCIPSVVKAWADRLLVLNVFLRQDLKVHGAYNSPLPGLYCTHRICDLFSYPWVLVVTTELQCKIVKGKLSCSSGTYLDINEWIKL